MDFEQAIKIVLQHEGGYVNNPKDPGGETNFGITKKTAVEYGYTGMMRSIPMPVVLDIYRRNYWEKVKADQLPTEIRLALFDFAVNSGPERAIKSLQATILADQDGVIGPQTMKSVSLCDPRRTALLLSCNRLEWLTSLPRFDTFGEGWTRRVVSLIKWSALG
jgi:lysozyme family protein